MNIALSTHKPQTHQLENPKVNYVQQGSGEPVILVHGLAASLHDWDALLPELASAGYAAYALDLLGHGESLKPLARDEYTVESVFAHFCAWMDSLNITQPVTLVGHSLGGALSLMYTLRFPERVRALTLINPFYDIKQLSPVIQHPMLRQVLSAGLIELTPYWLFRFFVDVSSFNYYIGDRESHIMPEHIRYQTALDYTRAAPGIYNIVHTLPNLLDSLHGIQQPTLLLWGARDQTLGPASFPQLARILPNVINVHPMPLCGHVPHQCHSEIFNPHVMQFLKSYAPA